MWDLCVHVCPPSINEIKYMAPVLLVSGYRCFWHFYAISVCWNGFLLVLYLKKIFQHQLHPLWLTGVLDVLTGVTSTDIQGRLKSFCSVFFFLCNVTYWFQFYLQFHICPLCWSYCCCGSTPSGGCWNACLSVFSLMEPYIWRSMFLVLGITFYWVWLFFALIA